MSENTNMSEVISEVKNATEDELKTVIEQHFERVRTQGMKLGALYICAAIEGVCKKHLKKGAQASRRDYERCVEEILKITSVQTRQNDSKEETEEAANDGTAETIN